MISSTQYNSQTDFYFGMLQRLSAESKLELISRLSLALKEEAQTRALIDKNVALRDLFGALKTEETAEEMIERIRRSRLSNRQIEPL